VASKCRGFVCGLEDVPWLRIERASFSEIEEIEKINWHVREKQRGRGMRKRDLGWDGGDEVPGWCDLALGCDIFQVFFPCLACCLLGLHWVTQTQVRLGAGTGNIAR
jgi:hypothetical protein